MRAIIFAVLLAFSSGLALAGNVKPRVIYGDDDRRDLFAVQDPVVRNAALATVAFIENWRLEQDKHGLYHLEADPYGDTLKLCPDERFYEQKMAGFCSGVLIEPDVVLTAGHCLKNKKECQETSFVFDFRLDGPQSARMIFEPRQVRTCNKILHRELDKHGTDFALIQLNEPVADRSPVRLTSQQSKDNTLFMLGYPWGLPLKYVEGQIRSEDDEFYVTALDSSEGNSGSPVFSRNGDLLGILTEGEDDLVKDPRGCKRSKRCLNSQCSGETIFRVEAIRRHLDKGQIL